MATVSGFSAVGGHPLLGFPSKSSCRSQNFQPPEDMHTRHSFISTNSFTSLIVSITVFLTLKKEVVVCLLLHDKKKRHKLCARLLQMQ
jgi:hypothetical protein